ncbi:adenosylmethionine decarboxylase activity protein [Cryphonectria parasitica EP155]|uniref:Adenosylmethionine decarboxylase activity protein n=1 Tax=Cryphonectria parasitica (strain ATCC 38755 / EP155) TaxID=660469 RepID=A0A9P4YEU0_CRYP1|nr:adenosylmethionine decarboxylase activity protein [Cryphonectria parasitica EP155]KAF3771120.1 adenosylmethionine decarboxylase activity protein [Cryphonectria parasitica EP155]
MVDLEVPNSNVLSTSEGTPHLTINHDVAADLDSSNAFEGPEKLLEVWFAPSPSALPQGAKENGLLSVASKTWEGMLDLVHCQVLSVVSSGHMDAYLLSESSMFVFPHKLILKTCGTTTLLLGLRRLLRIAAVDAGFPFHNAQDLADENALASPYRVFYSRKNFLFPDKQHGPHRSWADEYKFLDKLFDNGSAYLVGKMNGDHWYLYITTPTAQVTPPRTPDSEKGSGLPVRPPFAKIPTGLMSSFPQMPAGGDPPDETLEILMTDLDSENAKQFYLSHASAVARERVPLQACEARQAAVDSLGDMSSDDNGASSVGSPVKSEDPLDVFDHSAGPGGAQTPMTDVEQLTTEGHALGTVVSDTCGLSEVYPPSKYPDARIDAYLFSPCGFSANAVIPAPVQEAEDGSKIMGPSHYFTVHVTPEPNCSFASFETNVPGGQKGRETSEVIEHVVGIFKPGRFIVTLFEAKGSGVPRTPDPYSMRKSRTEAIAGYRRVDRIVHQFDDYDLVFGFFEKDDWTGYDGARVGEMM